MTDKPSGLVEATAEQLNAAGLPADPFRELPSIETPLLDRLREKIVEEFPDLPVHVGPPLGDHRIWGPLNKTYYIPLRSPLAVNVSVELIRRERGTCAVCHKRRVRFQLVANTYAESDAVCGPCAGIR